MSRNGWVRIVYIVDDDNSVRRSLARLMRANGFESRCFTSPQQMLDEISVEPYGCVVLDITLAETMEAQLRKRLRELKIDMPIIAISARDDVEARDIAHRIGAQFFLSKPVDDHALLDTIAWVTEMTDQQGDADSGANE